MTGLGQCLRQCERPGWWRWAENHKVRSYSKSYGKSVVGGGAARAKALRSRETRISPSYPS